MQCGWKEERKIRMSKILQDLRWQHKKRLSSTILILLLALVISTKYTNSIHHNNVVVQECSLEFVARDYWIYRPKKSLFNIYLNHHIFILHFSCMLIAWKIPVPLSTVRTALQSVTAFRSYLLSSYMQNFLFYHWHAQMHIFSGSDPLVQIN